MSRSFSSGAFAPPAKSATKPPPGSTLRKLWPYIWPSGRRDLIMRIYVSLALLLAAKIVTIAVPYSFKWATDALTGPERVSLSGVIAGPLAFTLLYGGLRIAMALLTQLRDATFADVAMHAVRRLARDVFSHLHSLSLRFHLERKTGGLTRVLERGRNSIETIVRTTMLTAVPTVVEFVLILAVFLTQFNWRYAAVVSLMIVAYMGFTTAATNWRIAIRRAMNESDTDANTKAIDSLLNFETVKYFTAEEREKARYDKSIARYERMSVKTYTSLAWLNAGQAVIFTTGSDGGDGDEHRRHQERRQYGRRFRPHQCDDGAALSAAEFHGGRLSGNQTGNDRHRTDVCHSRPASGDRRPPGCETACRDAAAIFRSRMCRFITTRAGRY